MILTKDFYLQSTKKVAKELLGKYLVVKQGRQMRFCQIIETEAYLGIKDAACHSYKSRRTPRTEAMYAEVGQSYVYFIYGMYFCFNVVTRKEGIPEAVLIRALYEEGRPTRELAGPGKLCRELNITREYNDIDLTKKKRIWIEDLNVPRPKIIASTRIGVNYAGLDAKLPLRFYIAGHPAISKK
jgi:DNA-3-methyladenine glycosylase